MPSIFDHTYSLHRAGGFDLNFEISDSDDSGDPAYYGYLAYNGSYLIQKWVKSAGTYRYVAGQSGYATAWAGRAGLSYDYINVISGNVR